MSLRTRGGDTEVLPGKREAGVRISGWRLRTPDAWPLRYVRAALRLAGFGLLAGFSILAFGLQRLRMRRPLSPAERAQWLHEWSKPVLKLLNVRTSSSGLPPCSGLLVSNHLGYLDILVLASVRPLAFVAKSEVRKWPIIGGLASLAGTAFIDRRRRMEVARVGRTAVEIMNSGTVLAMFPEGTSSGGDSVLPFHSALFAPVSEHGWPATPAALRYELDDGDTAVDVAYWRDMTFFPHLLRLFGKREVRAHIHFGEAMFGVSDRKTLARQLRDAVCRMHCSNPPPGEGSHRAFGAISMGRTLPPSLTRLPG